MITRMWFGRTSLENADDYLDHLKSIVFPDLQQIQGFKGATILRRDLGDGVEFSILTTWRSLADIRKFAGEDVEVAVVPPEAQAVLSEYDATVRHYRVVHETKNDRAELG